MSKMSQVVLSDWTSAGPTAISLLGIVFNAYFRWPVFLRFCSTIPEGVLSRVHSVSPQCSSCLQFHNVYRKKESQTIDLWYFIQKSGLFCLVVCLILFWAREVLLCLEKSTTEESTDQSANGRGIPVIRVWWRGGGRRDGWFCPTRFPQINKCKKGLLNEKPNVNKHKKFTPISIKVLTHFRTYYKSEYLVQKKSKAKTVR